MTPTHIKQSLRRAPSRVIVALSFTGLLVAASQAFSQPLQRAHLQGEFKEVLNTDVVVSGAVIAGVDSANTLNGASLKDLVIHPGTAAEPRKVCLTASSRDGAYSASNDYQIPGGLTAAEPVSLPFHSLYFEQLNGYSDTEISVRATLGGCEAHDSSHYAVIHNGTDEPKQLRLFINSFSATDVYMSTSPGQEIDCDPLDGRRTTFDFVCVSPWPFAGSASIDVTVHREVFGRSLPDAKITVVRGG